MAKVDPQDFLLNTDYELDKIILVKTGDFISSASIQHGLDFTPLIFGVWSTDSNFSSGNTIGFVPSAEPIPGLYTPPLGVDAIAFKNKINISSTGENSTTTKIYYRIYALAPKDAKNAAATSKLAHEFMINTDYNYRKLKASGEFTQVGQSYKHNLGYIPQVMAWMKYEDMPDTPSYSNGIKPIASASYSTNAMFKVTSQKIEIANYPFGLIEKIIWRVYYDEA